MEKFNLRLLSTFIVCSFLTIFTSCEKEASDYVKEANKALENNDFAEAYQIYDEMNANNPHRGVPFHGDLEKEYDEQCVKLKDTIVKKELAVTIEDSEGTENIAKIIYIIDDKGAKDKEYYEYAIKLSRACGNDGLAAAIEKSEAD